MKTEVKEMQSKKADFSMAVTLLGITIDTSEEQPSKALLPMEATEEGISTKAREEQQ